MWSVKACPYGQRAKVDACVQALKFMQNCEEFYSADKIGRIMVMFDRFKSRLRKEERRQENLRTDEEGRMEVDGSTIDERPSPEMPLQRTQKFFFSFEPE